MGIRPEVVLNSIEFGETGYIFAVDSATGPVASHPRTELIGRTAAEIGLPAQGGAEGRCTVEGTDGHYVTTTYQGHVVGTFLPDEEYYAARQSQTLVVPLSMTLIFILLLVLINRMVGKKIVRPIHRIQDAMERIAGGDFQISVDERGNRDFAALSGSINTMVSGIRDSVEKNEQLMAQEQESMTHNLSLIENVKTVCANLDHASRATLDNAREISSGTQQQKQEVDNLSGVMDRLVTELVRSVEASTQVASVTDGAARKVEETQEKMVRLEQAIGNISEMSQAIVKIITEINSIARQTHMLSVNTSIEAARAGHAGAGFSVVAVQVGELAKRSEQSAKETNALIKDSLEAVNQGLTITQETMDDFTHLVREIQAASSHVADITRVVQDNSAVVSQAATGLERIASVAGANVTVSQDAQQVSANMASEASRLMDLVEE